MKPLPVLTALVVAIALYAFVFERARLLDLVGREPVSAETAPATPDAAPETATAAAAADARPRVVVIDSAERTIENTLSLRGETEASRRVVVQAETTGRIVSEPLPRGASVARGDVLCRIDPGTRQAQLAEAEARLAEAQISDTAAARLAEGGFASETRAVGARATLQAAQAAVDAARTEIDRLTIRAPFGGMLEDDTAELGTLMQPGGTCAEIMTLDPIRIVAYLPETRVGDVEAGAEARVTLPGGTEIDATVTFVARTADPETRTFRMDLSAPNPDGTIRDGQSAAIRVTTRGVAAHLVPGSALTLDDAGTMGVRVVDADGIVQFRPVRLVRDTAEGLLVTGLAPATRIIVVGQEYVRAGVAVDAVERAPS